MSFDIDSVEVVSTKLSTIAGTVQVLAGVSGIHSLAKANQLAAYLSARLQVTVGGIYDPTQQAVALSCFIPATLTFDARLKVRRELGVGALKHAFTQQ